MKPNSQLNTKLIDEIEKKKSIKKKRKNELIGLNRQTHDPMRRGQPNKKQVRC
jgi:hypothetical protein